MRNFLLLPLISFMSLFNRESNTIRVPLEFSPECPVLKVEIEGKTYPLMLDLGCSCEFALKRDILEILSKKERVGSHITLTLDGQQHTAPKYLLQRIRIQNGEVIHTIVEECNDIPSGISGKVGRNTLQTCNLLLDFPHSLLFIVKNFEDLKTGHYSIQDFKEVPFTQTRWGAVFSIETDFGINRFSINTIEPHSAIGNISEKQIKEKLTTSAFKIGQIDFGNTDLEVISVDSSLNDIDGYLGIDFFKKNVVYLDFQNNKALIQRIRD